MLSVLEWVTATAILLSFATLLIRNSTFSLGPPLLEGIVEALPIGILTGVFSLPIALSVAMVLGVTSRYRFAFWSCVLFACVLGSLTMLGGLASFGVILASFHVSSIATLWVGRVFGFRLTRCTPSVLTVV